MLFSECRKRIPIFQNFVFLSLLLQFEINISEYIRSTKTLYDAKFQMFRIQNFREKGL